VDELNLFIKTKAVPDVLACRLRSFFRLQNKQHVETLTSWTDVLMELPMSLRSDVIATLGANSKLRNVEYFMHLRPMQAMALALELRTTHFPPGETLLRKGMDMMQNNVQVLAGGIIQVNCYLYNRSRYYLSTVSAPVIGEELFWPGGKLASCDVLSATTSTLMSIEGDRLLKLMKPMSGYGVILKEGRLRYMRQKISHFCTAAQRIADFCAAVTKAASRASSRAPPRIMLADILLVGGFQITGHRLCATVGGRKVDYGEESMTVMVEPQTAMYAAEVAAPEIYERALAAAIVIQRWYARMQARARVRNNLRYYCWKALAVKRRDEVEDQARFAKSTTSKYLSRSWLTSFVLQEDEDSDEEALRAGKQVADPKGDVQQTGWTAGMLQESIGSANYKLTRAKSWEQGEIASAGRAVGSLRESPVAARDSARDSLHSVLESPQAPQAPALLPTASQAETAPPHFVVGHVGLAAGRTGAVGGISLGSRGRS
jgi:hypothetical protein